MDITKRIDLNMGYGCNIRCRFCYYQESVCKTGEGKNLTTKEVKRWIAWFRKKGIEEIDLTGGEPTIRQDIFEVAQYCKELGYKTICVITNGLKMSDKGFCERLLQSGVNDILFSIHGPDASIHDNLTGMPGSFDKIIKAVENIKELSSRYPVTIRSNSVVNGVNYKLLGNTAELLYKLGFKITNFIMFNPIVEAQSSDSDMNVTYSEAAPYLKAVLDAYKDKFIRITIRYMPFCIMPGFESHITNTAQIQYDPYEWDYYLRTRFRNGFFLWLGALFAGFLLHPSKDRFPYIGWNRSKHEAIKYALAFWNKTKGPGCKKCSYRNICDGLWRDYAKHRGFDELKPFGGILLTEPAHFLKESYK